MYYRGGVKRTFKAGVWTKKGTYLEAIKTMDLRTLQTQYEKLRDIISTQAKSFIDLYTYNFGDYIHNSNVYTVDLSDPIFFSKIKPALLREIDQRLTEIKAMSS